MRFIIVFVTIFSGCCCFSVLNISPSETTGPKDNLLLPGKRTLLNYPLADEKNHRFQRSTDKIVKDYKQRPILEESKDILSEHSQRVQQNSKLFAGNDDNDFRRSPPIKNWRRRKHPFIKKGLSTKEGSEEVNGKITGVDKSETTSEDPDYNGELQIMPTTTDRKDKATNPGSLRLLFRNKGTEKPEETTEDPECDEDQEKRSTTIDPKLTAKSSGSWSLLSWNKDSGDSSHKIQLIENFESGLISETGTDAENSTDSVYATTEYGLWNIIWPGTKWCGSGNIAINDDDLGYLEDVDRCCRTHDNCFDIMLPGKSKYNLTNTSPFTVLSCECDDQLYDCLSQIDSFAANAVANIFFNIVGRRCYTLDYPKICKKHTMFGCQEYEIDETAEKVYQWKPAKKYHKMPFVLPG